MSKKPEKIKAKLDPLINRLDELGKKESPVAIFGSDYDILLDKKE